MHWRPIHIMHCTTASKGDLKKTKTITKLFNPMLHIPNCKSMIQSNLRLHISSSDTRVHPCSNIKRMYFIFTPGDYSIPSYHSIKLLTLIRCDQTPQNQSSTDPKPVCHFDPLLPRIVYLVWPFDSCVSLWVPVQNVKGVFKWFQWKEEQLAALLQNFSAYWINFIGKGKAFHGLLL